MGDLGSIWLTVQNFIDRGGPVLQVIFVVISLMLALVFERMMYFRGQYKRDMRDVVEAWEARSERTSWHAHQIRLAMISQVKEKLNQNVGLIRTLVAICPLCGLLGTVTGMILVFDVMAFFGSGNARAMASGVSRATIPTMAGMVGALIGVFAATYIERAVEKRAEQLEDHLTMDH